MKQAQPITSFHQETSADVSQALIDIQGSGQKVRLFYGDPVSGKAWPEVTEVFGRIGADEEQAPVFIDQGGQIRDSSIVGILGRAGKWLYRHPKLDLGAWEIIESPDEDYLDAVTYNGQVIELFKKAGQSRRFKDYMTGRRATR